MQRPSHAAILVLAGYLAATLLYIGPLLPRWEKDVPSFRNGFDVPAQAFLLAWGWDAMRHHPHAVFDAPIFYPERRTLTYMDAMLGEVVAAAPVLAVTGSVASGYNFLIALSYFLSAWFTYRLARAIGASRRGAFLSGILFAFSTYRLTHVDFLNQLQTEFLPLGLTFGVRYLQKPRIRLAIGLSATAVAQLYFGWYYAYILFLALVLLAFYAWWSRSLSLEERGRPNRILVLLVALLVLLLAAPTVIPYVQQNASMPEFRRTLGQTALYSADLLDYVRASDLSIPASRLFLPAGVNALFLGVVMIGLAAIGARGRGSRRAPTSAREIAGFFPWLAIASFVLSLGPVLHVAARRFLIPLPYAAIYFVVPGIASLRAPFRFSVLVFLAGAVLAGVGYGAVDRYLRRARPRLRSPVFVGLAAIALATAWPRNVTTLALPTATTMPSVYRWLEVQSPKEPILEFPTPARDEDETATQAIRQYCVVLHGSPRLDGSSGFVSQRYRSFRREIQTFPDSPARALAARMGARWIIVHLADYPAPEREAFRRRLEDTAALTRVAAFGSDLVYRLDQGP